MSEVISIVTKVPMYMKMSMSEGIPAMKNTNIFGIF